jgi:hypothetical protein
MTRSLADLESYELHPTSNSESDSASSPLLPAYSSHPAASTVSQTGLHDKSPSSRRTRQSGRACRAALILSSLIAPILLGGALVGCYTGHGQRVLDRVKDWGAVPQDVKNWLDGETAGGVGHDSKHDSKMFPTEYVADPATINVRLLC